jgi:elongation factor Ts
MNITPEQVKELRSLTGCGFKDCREALAESSGDLERAVIILRQKGKAGAAKKSAREAREGVVAAYVHTNGKLGVILSLRCETDFVARNEKFIRLAHDIAIHVAAMEPQVIKPEDLDPAYITAETNIAAEQAAKSGKPAAIQAKMVAGKLEKFKKERALLTQPYVKDPSKTVQDLITAAIAELGENIVVDSFHRLAV